MNGEQIVQLYCHIQYVEYLLVADYVFMLSCLLVKIHRLCGQRRFFSGDNWSHRLPRCNHSFLRIIIGFRFSICIKTASVSDLCFLYSWGRPHKCRQWIKKKIGTWTFIQTIILENWFVGIENFIILRKADCHVICRMFLLNDFSFTSIYQLWGSEFFCNSLPAL